MEERQLQMRVGLFVVMAMVVLGILIFINSEGWRSKYELMLKTDTAPGVTQNTPIRKNGILIGRVGSVRTQDDQVEVTLQINDDEHVYENEIVSIGTDSILGDSVLEVVPVGIEKRGEPLQDGGKINYVSVKRNPMEIIDVAINLESKIADALDTVKKAGASIERAGDGVNDLTTKVSEALGNQDSDFKQLLDNFKETNRKAQVALDNFNQIFEGINEVVGDEEMKQRFQETVRKLPEILKRFEPQWSKLVTRSIHSEMFPARSPAIWTTSIRLLPN
ncbi:MAG: MlaD family protein [Pirellulaceae bacterium]